MLLRFANLRVIGLSVALATLFAYPLSATAEEKKKVVIFFSSIGQGHISAAKAIEAKIKEQNPGAEVVMKNIRDFMPPLHQTVDEKLYWLIVKKFPDTFAEIFYGLQEKGNKAWSLADLKTDYPEEKVLEFLKQEKPTAVLATHYGSAQVLGNLREKGQLTDTKLGWMHTDYFKGYFPRISMRLDQSFVAHDELERQWLSSNVSPDRVVTTGMPVSVKPQSAEASLEFMKENGLDPKTRTITLMGGGEGIGDFPGIVRSIAANTKDPVQIVAICAKNQQHQKDLAELQKKLPPNVKLKILGLVPQKDVVSYVTGSNLFITKAGGLSPAEGFTLGRPIILLDAIGGHERENAMLFQRLGLAELNQNVSNIGKEINQLLSDEEKIKKMLVAQEGFRKNLDISKIANFALDEKFQPNKTPANFGLEGGSPAKGVAAALKALDKDSPADIEILLSYSNAKENTRVAWENPFGHIGLRIKNKVYSANHKSDPTKDTSMLQAISLEDYLYGVKKTQPTQEHLATYGMAYGRDTIGFRIAGVPKEALAKMIAEADLIDDEFRKGICAWNLGKANCADFTTRILKAGGFDVKSMPGLSLSPWTMPLDTYDKLKTFFEENPRYRTEAVAYQMLPDRNGSYKYSRFPLSLGQISRTVGTLVRGKAPAEVEQHVGKRLIGYTGDEHVHYDNLNQRSVAVLNQRIRDSETKYKEIQDKILTESMDLEEKRPSLSAEEYARLKKVQVDKELRYFVDRNYDFALIATETATDRLGPKKAKKINASFEKIIHEYGKLNTATDAADFAHFFTLLQEYDQTLQKEVLGANASEQAFLKALLAKMRELWNSAATKLVASSQVIRAVATEVFSPNYKTIDIAKAIRESYPVKETRAPATNIKCDTMFSAILRGLENSP